jgi:hypothetical protein
MGLRPGWSGRHNINIVVVIKYIAVTKLSKYRGRPGREGRNSRVGMAWPRQHVVAKYRACDMLSMKEIWVNRLGTALCNECGEVPWIDSRGFQACRCTVWNDGKPREEKASDLALEVRRANMVRACKSY